MNIVSCKIPRIKGEYVHVMKPGPDRYAGQDSLCFQNGTLYQQWIPNDFSVVKGADGRWHIIGITHPAPNDYIPMKSYNPSTVHDAEWQLFHAVSPAGRFCEVAREGAFVEHEKLLYPSERPGELNEIHAPHIIRHQEKYWMFYGPRHMRVACSDDLFSWKPQGILFEGDPTMRDPNLLFDNGVYKMTYVSENKLYMRSSENLLNWSEPLCVFEMPWADGAPESPFVLKFEGLYYLFWCMYDGQNGVYDNRTFVFVSETLLRFENAPVAILPAHAPEVVTDENGDHYLASAEWPHRGISVAKLEWI